MEWLNTFVVHKHALYMQLLQGKREGKGDRIWVIYLMNIMAPQVSIVNKKYSWISILIPYTK